VWYDNIESLAGKYALAASLGLRGVGVWEVDALNYYNATQVAMMWDTISDYFL